ncbi:hypothetical protein IWZ00DRAFT_381873 [Phyllosticta capitalensis]
MDVGGQRTLKISYRTGLRRGIRSEAKRAKDEANAAILQRQGEFEQKLDTHRKETTKALTAIAIMCKQGKEQSAKDHKQVKSMLEALVKVIAPAASALEDATPVAPEGNIAPDTSAPVAPEGDVREDLATPSPVRSTSPNKEATPAASNTIVRSDTVALSDIAIPSVEESYSQPPRYVPDIMEQMAQQMFSNSTPYWNGYQTFGDNGMLPGGGASYPMNGMFPSGQFPQATWQQQAPAPSFQAGSMAVPLPSTEPSGLQYPRGNRVGEAPAQPKASALEKQKRSEADTAPAKQTRKRLPRCKVAKSMANDFNVVKRQGTTTIYTHKTESITLDVRTFTIPYPEAKNQYLKIRREDMWVNAKGLKRFTTDAQVAEKG